MDCGRIHGKGFREMRNILGLSRRGALIIVQLDSERIEKRAPLYWRMTKAEGYIQ